MADFVIPCPNPTCRKPLNLPAAAIGRPLSCPHCKTPIGVTLNPDGTPTEPVVLPTSKRTPGMFLLPGFALLILGGAGVFMNGYIAWDAATQPGKDLVHSQRLVNDLRLSGSLKTGTPESKGTVGDAIPFELFGAVAGPAPGVAEQAKKAEEQAQADEALAAAWAPRVAPLHSLFLVVSAVSAAGGVAILRGKWYWLALVGCVAGMLNLNSLCCVPAGIAGLWGILVLARDDGRKFFGRTA
jgi:hypothetical protein